MHRLFVAIRPPAATRDALIDLMEGLPGARWQDDDQLHLTLRFIGEVDGHLAEDVAASLGHISFSPIDISLSGLGHFGTKGRAESLWIRAEPKAPLAALHERINVALDSAGLDPEHRAFMPHVTIARFGRAGAAVESFLSRHAGVSLPPFRAEHFALLESHLGREGASYETIARYPLDR